MATTNEPGVDSIYVAFKNPGNIQSAISKAKNITTEVADVIERVTLKSRFVWWGDKEMKTADGDVVTEISKEMIEAQMYFLNDYPENCYDRITLRALLPVDEVLT